MNFSDLFGFLVGRDGGLGFMEVFPVVVFVVVVLVFIVSFRPLWNEGLKKRKLIKRLSLVGQFVQGKIVGVEDIGITMNNNPYLKLEIQIKSGVQTSLLTRVSRIAIPRIGDSIDLVYDPSNPSDVVLASSMKKFSGSR